jgi:hypothetical protein
MSVLDDTRRGIRLTRGQINVTRDELAEGMARAVRRRNERLALVTLVKAPPPADIDPALAEELDRLAEAAARRQTPSRNGPGSAIKIRGLW